jgi:hypothetical protein
MLTADGYFRHGLLAERVTIQREHKPFRKLL